MRELVHKIAVLAADALKEEVLLTPKPGLVDCADTGAHQDMSVELFLTSIHALSPYFAQYLLEGCTNTALFEDQLFSRIQAIGIQAEQSMFHATEGINTHKGAHFSFALILTSIGIEIRQKRIHCLTELNQMLTVEEVLHKAGNLAAYAAVKASVAMESNGERTYHQYGFGGIKEEACQGFPSLLNACIELRKKITVYPITDDLYLHTLLHLMAHVNDSNVLHRAGLEGLQYVQTNASTLLSNGGLAQSNARTELMQFNQELIQRNISPGGSADLLALAIFFHKLQLICS